MKNKSFDVMISPAVAYSTLGWFEDPLLDTMLQYSNATLAGIMFHEMAHEKLYVKSDTAFNEAFASFVEETGVHLWLSETGQLSKFEEWENKKLASIQFNHLLKESQLQLRTLYASELPDEAKRQQKKHIFNSLRSSYSKQLQSNPEKSDYYAEWMAKDLNNAHLALLNSYEGGICAFTTLFEQAGQDLERFYTLANEKAELDAETRQAWLERPCERFAFADVSIR